MNVQKLEEKLYNARVKKKLSSKIWKKEIERVFLHRAEDSSL